ncbi:MAG: ABC transporter substrate-binding protein [Proteobacteria bacterium]|nr:ABC transporter substrate-binding protein [Pseudomonadota bacterium]
MDRRHKMMVIRCVLGLVAVVAIYLIMAKPKGESAGAQIQQDLSDHPIYSTYHFSPLEGVVRIGIQPFWVFAANLAEAMRRDRLLTEDLTTLGLRLEFYSFLKGPDINFFMEKGQLDVGMSGYLPTLRQASRQDVVVAATMDRNFYDLVAVKALTIKDLEGKNIGFTPGSDAHHALVEALLLTGTKANLVPLDGNEMPAAMRSGQIDAGIIWEPVASVLRLDNPGARVVYRSRWASFLYFRGDFAKAQPQAIAAILAALARASRWLDEDSDNVVASSRWAIDACRALAPTDPLVLADFITQSKKANILSGEPVLLESDMDDRGLLASAFQFLKDEDMIPAGTEWEKVRATFDARSMESILSEPQKWRLNRFDYENKEEWQ